MKIKRMITTGLLLVLVTATPSRASEEEKEDWNITWKKGVSFTRADGDRGIKIGGRIQHDLAGIANEGFSTEFRRIRITLSGFFAKDVIFKTQYDFASTGDPLKDDTPAFKDAYIGAKNVPFFGTIKLGHVKEPLSLEMMQSSNGLTFMERGLSYAFVSDRNTGIRAENTAFDKNMTWQAGVFVPTGDKGFSPTGDDEYHLTARVTGTPLYSNDGGRMIHLGLGVTQQFGDNVEDRITERPESHLAPKTLDTGTFQRDNRFTFGAEAAWVHDSFALQSEYMGTTFDNAYLHGGYAEASYYLTGEHRNYIRKKGKFTNRVDPNNENTGAWQIASRVSFADLQSDDIAGGKEFNVTTGVNWYYRKNIKVSMNYVWGTVDPGDQVNIVQARTQILF